MNEGERIIKLETQMNNIEKKVEDGFKASEKRFDSLEDTMKKFIEKSDTKFASKWVEKVVWGVCTVVGCTLLGAALSKIIIK
ncbi:MAG: hypothetical protein V4481_05295 [Patescibacteria group bacterium]